MGKAAPPSRAAVYTPPPQGSAYGRSADEGSPESAEFDADGAADMGENDEDTFSALALAVARAQLSEAGGGSPDGDDDDRCSSVAAGSAVAASEIDEYGHYYTSQALVDPYGLDDDLSRGVDAPPRMPASVLQARAQELEHEMRAAAAVVAQVRRGGGALPGSSISTVRLPPSLRAIHEARRPGEGNAGNAHEGGIIDAVLGAQSSGAPTSPHELAAKSAAALERDALHAASLAEDRARLAAATARDAARREALEAETKYRQELMSKPLPGSGLFLHLEAAAAAARRNSEKLEQLTAKVAERAAEVSAALEEKISEVVPVDTLLSLLGPGPPLPRGSLPPGSGLSAHAEEQHAAIRRAVPVGSVGTGQNDAAGGGNLTQEQAMAVARAEAALAGLTAGFQDEEDEEGLDSLSRARRGGESIL